VDSKNIGRITFPVSLKMVTITVSSILFTNKSATQRSPGLKMVPIYYWTFRNAMVSNWEKSKELRFDSKKAASCYSKG
jgi:hypothetical protein